MTTLGPRIRQLRVEGVPYRTQRQLAELTLNGTPQWVSKVEADRVKPTLDELADLAFALAVDIDELIPLWQAWEEAPAPDYSTGICRGRAGW